MLALDGYEDYSPLVRSGFDGCLQHHLAVAIDHYSALLVLIGLWIRVRRSNERVPRAAGAWPVAGESGLDPRSPGACRRHRRAQLYAIRAGPIRQYLGAETGRKPLARLPDTCDPHVPHRAVIAHHDGRKKSIPNVGGTVRPL